MRSFRNLISLISSKKNKLQISFSQSTVIYRPIVVNSLFSDVRIPSAPVSANDQELSIVTVARLAPEKIIPTAIRAVVKVPR